MATIKEIKEALEKLDGTKVIDTDIVAKEAIKKRLETMYKEMPKEEIDKQVEEIIKNKAGDLYNKISVQVGKLNAMIGMAPAIIAQITASIAAISGASAGTAAPAVPGMMASLKTTVDSAKTAFSDALSTALEIGVDNIPGIDPIIDASNTIGSIIP